jgi:hypothetical protein
MVNPQLSGLPAFLVRDGELNSGFMLAPYTAAALVSENKALSHPASRTLLKLLDSGACPGPRSGVRRNDERGRFQTFYDFVNNRA